MKRSALEPLTRLEDFAVSGETGNYWLPRSYQLPHLTSLKLSKFRFKQQVGPAI